MLLHEGERATWNETAGRSRSCSAFLAWLARAAAVLPKFDPLRPDENGDAAIRASRRDRGMVPEQVARRYVAGT